ncbi:MAG: hypothetical protein M1818_005281 [Claussenomyces sp. TS43310]|nr:MAG: hypothetical protein M1818_005281 [Claussenomyces sp. TS43310]
MQSTTSPLPASPAAPLGDTGSNSGDPYNFPPEYHFPAFFTQQPTSTTFHAQCSKWAALILAYCRARHLFKISLIDAVDSELFHNTRLGRRLDLGTAREMVDFMQRHGRAEWIGSRGATAAAADKNVCWVWWKNPEEWATLIADWVDETGQKNTVLTLYELTESEATKGQEFHGMDPELLQKALNVLVKRGKAQVFGHEDGQGVKFF